VNAPDLFAFEDVDGQKTIGIWFGAVANGGLALYRPGEPVGFTEDPIASNGWLWSDRPATTLFEALSFGEELAGLARRVYERGETGKKGLDARRPDPEARARLWMRTQRPSVSHADGDRALARVAVYLVRGFRLEPDGAALRILAEYNSRARPPWPEKKLRDTLVWAEKEGRLPWGYCLDVPVRGRS
jgi:hypothetical protein